MMPTTVLRLRAKLIISTVVSVLFAVTYKNDAAILADSRWLSTYVQPAYITSLKQNSIMSLAVLPVAALVMMLTRPRIANPMGIAGFSLTLLFVFELARMSVAENTYGMQILAGGVIFSIFYFMAMCVQSSRRRGEMPYAVLLGMSIFALGHVALNLSMLVTGLGYHNSRFLGTSVQPNFIGVQMAIAALVLWGWLPQRLLPNIMRWLGLGGAVLLLVLSGSRTGLVLFASGACIYFCVRGVKAQNVAIVIFLGIATVLTLLALTPPDFDLAQYDRGGTDTRQLAWQTMSEAVRGSPIFGLGRLPQASESSYLRGWGTVGLLFPLAFAVTLVGVIAGTIRFKLRYDNDRVFATLAACVFGCLTAGFFEGYLIDTFSFTLFAFLFALTGFEGNSKSGPGAT